MTYTNCYYPGRCVWVQNGRHCSEWGHNLAPGSGLDYERSLCTPHAREWDATHAAKARPISRHGGPSTNAPSPYSKVCKRHAIEVFGVVWGDH